VPGARDLLAAHAHEPVPLAAAARAAFLSPFHFQRLFTRAFGESPHRFLTRRRIELAKQLLAGDQFSITEICLETGYASLGSFSAKFHAGAAGLFDEEGRLSDPATRRQLGAVLAAFAEWIELVGRRRALPYG
jgi:hypothetical protein